MTPFGKIAAIVILSLATAGTMAACGGSDSKSSSSDSSLTMSGSESTETTTASSGSASLITVNITYVSCTGSTLTITTDNASLSSAEVTRYDASDVQKSSSMTKNADGSWSGSIPSGAGYEDRITVFATGTDGKKSSRSSPLPLQLEDGTMGTCS